MTHEEINRYKVAIAEEKEENAYLRERVRKAEHKLDAIVDILKDGAPKYAPVNRMVISEKITELKKKAGLRMETRKDILKRDFSEDFVEKMRNAIEMSHYKYGWAGKTYPELAQARKCIQERLDLYNRTHNKEYLVDIGNFAMLEYLYPSYKDAGYKPTDSDASPGLAGGISYKQLIEMMEDQ